MEGLRKLYLLTYVAAHPQRHGKRSNSDGLCRQVEELSRLWNTVARNAARNSFAHGLPIDTGKLEDLQHWVNTAPQEFEKDIATLLFPPPTTRAIILGIHQEKSQFASCGVLSV